MTLVAKYFPLFLLGRFIQGAGACGTLVSVFAIVRDTYTHDRLVHTMGVVMAMVGICPALAPLLGSVLTEWMGWQASFYFLAFIGLFYFLCIRLFFVESQKKRNFLPCVLNLL